MDDDRNQQIATFRFGVIHDLVGGVELSPGQQEQLLREKISRKWLIPFSTKSRLTRSTILRWVKLYKDAGGRLDALCTHSRSDQGTTRAVDQETALGLIRMRKELPRATIARLISEMKARGLVSPGVELAPSTVNRFLHRHNLMTLTQPVPEDRRRFEAEFPNDLWQSDCMHGPTVDHQNKRRKTYLLAFLDDHSRLVPHAEFFLAESLDCYMKAFEQALLTRGLPRKLYTDNGAAFRSHHLDYVTASLGIALVHARPYKPQGKGKIERFFRTVRSNFLPGFKGDTLHELNETLHIWLQEIYHRREHSSTGQNPFDRFTSHMECIRQAPDNLKDYFRKTARRRVAKDRTISLNGKAFEAPVALIGKQVTLLYHDDAPEHVEIKLGDKSYGTAVPVDLHVNCRVRRDKYRNVELREPDEPRTYQGGSLWGKGGKS